MSVLAALAPHAATPPAVLGLLDIGPLEFLVLAVAAVMLFGGDLPDVMRRAGRFAAKLRGMAQDIGRSANMPEDVARLPGTARDIAHEISSLSREAGAGVPPTATPAPEAAPGATPPAAAGPPAAGEAKVD